MLLTKLGLSNSCNDCRTLLLGPPLAYRILEKHVGRSDVSNPVIDCKREDRLEQLPLLSDYITTVAWWYSQWNEWCGSMPVGLSYCMQQQLNFLGPCSAYGLSTDPHTEETYVWRQRSGTKEEIEMDKRVVGRFTVSNQAESRGQLPALRDKSSEMYPELASLMRILGLARSSLSCWLCSSTRRYRSSDMDRAVLMEGRIKLSRKLLDSKQGETAAINVLLKTCNATTGTR